MPGGMALEQSVGIPMPRFTKSPSFISATARWMIPSRVSAMRAFSSALPNRPPLDALLSRRDDDAVDEDTGRVNALRVERSRRDELLHLGDRDPSRRDRHRVEIAGGLSIDEIPQPVPLPRGHERKISHDAPLEQVFPPVEDLGLLALRHQR